VHLWFHILACFAACPTVLPRGGAARGEHRSWQSTRYQSLDDAVPVPRFAVSLSLARPYRSVELRPRLGNHKLDQAGLCDGLDIEVQVSGGVATNIETTRLFLRRPSLADVPALFEFLGDAEAMRYTHTDTSLRECRRRIAVHEWRRRRDGYAPWTIVTKTDNRIIGWGGLYDDPFDPRWGVEVGYFFHPAIWGRGYATELLGAAMSVADDVLRLPEVRAFARPENIGSQRALLKAGFEVVRLIPEMERFLYRRIRRSNPTAT
jgi:ribosomal-protein-alanine N-acetyltransferase